ncbi:acyltransferase [uncultured Bacteroides sp.]|uniref:acyltransferase family protein n=1 Tax=uncultured Bacteroides sp. TaxID=162156 RepID=UPI00262FBE4F|nr:acyltransferase [uncultured Bacteroides sp.]
MKNITSSASFADSKPHYDILDGLRGVAALLVIWYHVFEAFATSPLDQGFNHGYLAVDFFFVLSGFVVGYAYDDRWKRMRMRDFFKRRLIRLHPMVVMGALLGVVTFVVQGCVKWDGTPVPFSHVMLAMLLGLFLIPALPGSAPEVRGNGEMFPLNGPSWSLFFEYIGNLLYALFLHRLSTRALAVLVAVAGAGLASFALFNLSGFGHLGVGWSLLDYNLPGGLLRMTFSFSAGLLMSRVFRPVHIRGTFWWCSLGVAVLLCIPHLGADGTLWHNGLYDSLCTLFFFPLLVWLGASGRTTDRGSTRICKFLGDISYPLYIIHYPFMYLFYAWVWREGLSFSQAWPMAVAVFVGSILLAWLCLKLYDGPVRRWLSRKFLERRTGK